MIKYSDLNKKGKLVIKGGAFVLVGTLATSIILSSCRKKDENEKIVSDIPVDTGIENTIETTENNNSNSIYSDYYNEIDSIEEDVTNLINDGLANGLFDYGVDGPSEENKEFMATTYLNYYLALNNEDLTGNTLDILNQEGDLTSYELIEDTLRAESGLQGQSIISSPETVMDFENLIIQEDDREFITLLATAISQMAEATRNNDIDALDEAAARVIEIKESLLIPTVRDQLESSTISLALMYVDAADTLYNGDIITTDEEKEALYNATIGNCDDLLVSLTDEQIINIARELNIPEYSTMTVDEIKEYLQDAERVSIGTDLRSASRVMLRHILEEQLAYSNIDLSIVDSYYSYRELLIRIENGIDLSLYQEPADIIETLNSNPYGANYYAEDGTLLVGTTTTVEVTPEEVPESEIIETTTEYVSYEENESGEVVEVQTNDTYLQARTAGLTDGNNAADQAYPSQYLNPNDMPVNPMGNVSTPSSSSTNYTAIYNYFYNQAWNAYRASAVSAYNAAVAENEQAQIEYIEGEEELVTEGTVVTYATETTTIETSTTETSTTQVIQTESDFIPFEGEEELIEEGQVVKSFRNEYIALLKAAKEELINNYVFAEENNNIKTRV